MISRFFIDRPVFANVIAVLTLLLGVVALKRLPIERYPAITPPTVTVSTNYPGANAEVVETRITQVLEAELSGIEGVKNIRSQSRDGQASLTVEFYLNRNLDEAANDVRDRVSRVSRRLPDDATLAADLPDASRPRQALRLVGVRHDTEELSKSTAQ